MAHLADIDQLIALGVLLSTAVTDAVYVQRLGVDERQIGAFVEHYTGRSAFTSAAMLVWRPLETGIGSYGLKAIGKVRGDEAMMANADSIRRQSVREVTYLGSMLSDGWNASLRTFMEGEHPRTAYTGTPLHLIAHRRQPQGPRVIVPPDEHH